MTPSQTPPILRGTYTAPALRRGDRADCLYRDCLMVVTHWSDAPIPWPVGRQMESRGRSCIIVDEELVRAVRQESAAAVAYWWGVSGPTVAKWRKAFDVNRKNNAGTQVLVRAATHKARGTRSPVPTEETRQKQREHSIRRRFWELRPKATRGKTWTPDQQSVLGTMTDKEAAALTGHPLRSVGHMRRKLQIPPYGNGGQKTARRETSFAVPVEVK